MAICICNRNRRNSHCEAHMGFTKKLKRSFKARVQPMGEYVLDYSESLRERGLPCWFIGKGRVAGNTTPIPSGLHATPRQAWKGAYVALVEASLDAGRKAAA